MFASIEPYAEAMRAGASCESLIRQTLDHIDRQNPAINALNHVAHETALAAAKRIDQRRADGEELGDLAGIPVAVKDAICTADMPTTCGSRMLANYQPPFDAHIVQRLRHADAILIGKSNMDEFAMGASTETSASGPTRNPWDPQRTPGGSSGGAAACVAASMVPLSIGSDTGGSIRQPAAFCGVTGLKPTYGNVSRYGLVAFASSLDQIGPIASSVDDCRRLYRAIAGPDPRDTTSIKEPRGVVTGKSDNLSGVRIGRLPAAMDHDGVDPVMRRAVSDAIDVLRSLGATIVDIDLPHSDYWVPTYYVIAPSEASSNLSRFDAAHYGHRCDGVDDLAEMYCRSRDEGFGAEVKRRIMIGTYALSEGYADQYYNQALKVRRLIKQDFDQAFASVDAIIGPVTPTPPFKLGDKLDDPVAMYLCDLFTVGANLAGIPAISIPAGIDSSGDVDLPLGIQLQAAATHENRLFQIGSLFQSVTQHHLARPPQTSSPQSDSPQPGSSQPGSSSESRS